MLKFLYLPRLVRIGLFECYGWLMGLIRTGGVYSKKYKEYLHYYKHGSPDYGSLPEVESKRLDVTPSDPVVTKAEVKENFEQWSKSQLISLGAKTSGSTGSGLKFKKSFFAEQDTFASFDAFRALHGVEPGTWCGYFCGNLLALPDSDEFFFRVKTSRQLIFSQYCLNIENVDKYVAVLNDEKPLWIHGYPSFLSELVRLSKLRGCQITYRPKLVSVGSESIDIRRKDFIGEFFRAPVREIYHQTEMVALFFECPVGKLHVNELYSGVEFVPSADGLRIIGSNYNNVAFKLKRYDTGDLAENVHWGECDCGFSGRTVSRIIGRSDDYLISASGVKVGRLDHIFKGFFEVQGAQLVQSMSSGRVDVLIVGSFEKFDLVQFDNRFQNYLRGVEYQVKFVESIPAEPNGKQKFVKRV